MKARYRVTALFSVLLIAGAGSGCKKKVAPPQPAAPPAIQEPAPPPPAPEPPAAEPAPVEPAPVPVIPPPPVMAKSLDDRIAELSDAFFDYDRDVLRDDARAALTANAAALRAIFADFPTAAIIVEGHADERGSAEYNLCLSERRAEAAAEFLRGLGVGDGRLKVIGYGKERPQCTEAAESCWQKNRRAHFAAAPVPTND